ncbi:hypothetical protein SUGI_0174580 [Cryptomeria japonica]|nr:hypothetical protein SUGI_0174580 [Cryptomeria japonica]
MGSVKRVVGVKSVDVSMPIEAWDERMPLPGDILLGVAARNAGVFDFFTAPFPGGKEGLNDELRKLHREMEQICIKVKRNMSVIDLIVFVVAEKSLLTNKRYTLRACSDVRHVVEIDDLTEQQCLLLQEETRKVLRSDIAKQVCMDMVPYDWKEKGARCNPNDDSPVIFSVLFMPFKSFDNSTEFQSVEETTRRSMGWFYGAQSSGVPLIFVNIQTEQILSSCSDMQASDRLLHSLVEKEETLKPSCNSGREIIECSGDKNITIDIVKGVRLWFLPGLTEMPIDLKPRLGEKFFGMEISRTEEGFCYISAVSGSSAADQAGLKKLLERAGNENKLLVISRAAGTNVTPSKISCRGLICCFNISSLKEILLQSLRKMENVRIHIMVWDEGSTTPACTGTPSLCHSPANLPPVPQLACLKTI